MGTDMTEVVCGSVEDIKRFTQWVEAYEGDRPHMYSSTQRPDILSSYYSRDSESPHQLLSQYLIENDGSFAYSTQAPVGSNIAFTRVDGKGGFVFDARAACNTEFEGFGRVDIEDKDMIGALREFTQLSVRDVDNMSGDLFPFMEAQGIVEQRTKVDTAPIAEDDSLSFDGVDYYGGY